MADFYDILGVSRDASQEDIKHAYRKLTKELHPDKHQNDKNAEQKFKEVNEAYETLKDEKKRKNYDQFGSAKGFRGFNGGAGGAQGFDFSGFSSGDFGGLGDIFESFFGGARGGQSQQQQAKGDDLEIAIEVDFEDTVKGAKKTVRITKDIQCETCMGTGVKEGSKLITCTTCGGTGQVTKRAQSIFGTIEQRMLCDTCKGAGKIPEEACKSCKGNGVQRKTVEVTIEVPAGLHEGQTLRLRGQGNAGPRGAPAGDLFVHIRVRMDLTFERDGDDIKTVVNISVLDAMLGTEIPVKTVHGEVRLKIPEGTQPNQVFRLKGKGMPVLGTSRTGDHYVTVHVEVPKKLSRAERKIVEEWKSLQ